MDNISISVSFIAAILGIAYPILFEVVSRLDEKYNSEEILNLFNSEWENRFFILALKASLFTILLWVLNFPPLIEIEGFNRLIGHSAQILLLTSTILLIISFFYFVRKILIYYTPTRFIPYLIRRFNIRNAI